MGVPTEVLNRVTPEMVWEAALAVAGGAPHAFGHSTFYDLVLPDGQRVPPKAVLGVVLANVIGRADGLKGANSRLSGSGPRPSDSCLSESRRRCRRSGVSVAG